MSEQDIETLRRRAEADDPAAMIKYGKLLLDTEGPGRHIPAGVTFIGRAAEAGHAEALAQLAVIAAAGIAVRAEWPRAMDCLQRAAELGWKPAQDDLRFMSGGTGDDFNTLRRAINLVDWMSPPETQLVGERPRILTAKSMMSKGECERMIAKTRGKLRRAGTYDPTSGKETTVDERSNSKAELTLTDVDIPIVLLQLRMSNLLGLPVPCFEPTNILHYAPGQEFKQHVDYLNMDSPGLAANMTALGQRIVTLLVYLNDGYEGGETHFPRLNYSFKGRTGDALMFGNVSEKGEPEPLSLHAGAPPRSGEKWVLSQWVRDRAPVAGR